MSVIMDSSPFHQPGDLRRTRDSLHPAYHPHRAAVQKRAAPPRQRAISTSQLDRLHNYALQHAASTNAAPLPSPAVTSHWISPQPSPQPQLFPASSTVDAFAHWPVPTPPRSDSSIPNLTFDSTDLPVNAVIATGFEDFQQLPTAGDMSSLGFLLPSQYGSTPIESEANSYTADQSYIPPVRVSQSPSNSSAPAYPQTTSTSPALYQSKSVSLPASRSRRESELSHASTSDPSYAPSYRRASQPYDALHGGDYTVAPSPSLPSVNASNHPQVPRATSMAPPSYTPNPSRSPNLYDSGMYAPQFTSGPPATQMYASSHPTNYPTPFVGSSVNEVLAKPLASDASIRVMNQRPKPQCWEHGCNGRQFSTFSNLLRHQREKSGTAAKSYCPKCGAEFTRTTARNGHLAHDKCTKQRQPGDDK